MSVKVAVIQAPPVLLDRAATISSMLRHIAEVAAVGVKLVIFPEAISQVTRRGCGGLSPAPTWRSQARSTVVCASSQWMSGEAI
jgi:hypothetical protein